MINNMESKMSNTIKFDKFNFIYQNSNYKKFTKMEQNIFYKNLEFKIS